MRLVLRILIVGLAATVAGGPVVAAAAEKTAPSKAAPAKALPAMTPMRQQNLETLERLGFKVAAGLPTARNEGPVTLRPLTEVATRLYTLAAVFGWAGIPQDQVRDHVLETAMMTGRLIGQATTPDLDILDLPRSDARRRYGDTVGWRLENMWALAWILGFDPPPSLGGQIDSAVHRRMLFDFLKFPKELPESLLKRAKPRSVEEVDRMEDLFYCAHNAVRSAQQGRKTVPDGFDPVRDGGAIHERRHALTWALSPGVEWDETDLST